MARARSTVVGLFHTRAQAFEAIAALRAKGFERDAISLLAPNDAATQEGAEDTGRSADNLAADAALAGEVLAVSSWLLLSALTLPNIGVFIVGGAFAALAGMGVGAGVGAIASVLVGMGLPEEHARRYGGAATAGKTLVAVHANRQADTAVRILRDHGAYDVKVTAATAASTGKATLQTSNAANRTARRRRTSPRAGPAGQGWPIP